MKRDLTTTLLTFGTCFSMVASPINHLIANPRENLFQDLKIRNVSSLTEQDRTQLMQGKCPEVAVEFSANSTLPLHIFLRGDLMSLVEEEGLYSTQLEIKQTFYVRCVQEELIFSSNLVEWKPFFEFVIGSASVGLGIQEDHLFITAGAETNLRL